MRSKETASLTHGNAARVAAGLISILAGGEIMADSAQAGITPDRSEIRQGISHNQLMRDTNNSLERLAGQIRKAAKPHEKWLSAKEVKYGGQPAKLLTASTKIEVNGRTYYDQFVTYTRLGEKVPFLSILAEGTDTPNYSVAEHMQIGVFLYDFYPSSQKEIYEIHTLRMNSDGSVDFPTPAKFTASQKPSTQKYHDMKKYLGTFIDVAGRIVTDAKSNGKPIS